MSILKIRDENGKVHPIAIMKGDKGDGVPDGGTPGQVIKKTESGTEWSDIAYKCDALFANTDVSIDSYTIEKRGLYAVKMFYSTADVTGAIAASSYVHSGFFLISVHDLDEYQWVSSLALVYMDNGVPKFRKAGIVYENKKFTATYNHVIVNGNELTFPTNKRAYLAEVRLIIPYE